MIDREHVGRLMHESWSRTKKTQGFHGPNDMDNCADKNYVAEETFFCQCGKLHPDLIPWEELREDQKDINRHAFDDVLPYFERLLAYEREKVREMCCKVMCFRCAEGNKPFDNGTTWLHLLERKISEPTREAWNEECEAAAIRQLDLTQDLAASSGEEGKK